MKGDLTWCKFRFSWIKVFKTLSNTEKERLFDAIEAYSNDKEMPELLGKESVAWAIIETELEADKESRRKAADSHREAGKNGGRPKNQTEPNETKRNQIGFLETKNNQNGLRVKELRVKELRVKENEEFKSKELICADAHNSQTKTEKLSPDDHDFWKFAKENAELAETFYRATGIYPVKSQFGRWVNDCKDLAEAEINADRLQKTITYMQSENIPLSAPGSCLKTAQWLKSRGSVPAKSQQKPKYNAFEEYAMKLNGIPVPEYDVEISS